MSGPRWWRQAYDVAERTVAPYADAVVRSAEFARATALAMATQAYLQRQLGERPRSFGTW